MATDASRGMKRRAPMEAGGLVRPPFPINCHSPSTRPHIKRATTANPTLARPHPAPAKLTEKIFPHPRPYPSLGQSAALQVQSICAAWLPQIILKPFQSNRIPASSRLAIFRFSRIKRYIPSKTRIKLARKTGEPTPLPGGGSLLVWNEKPGHVESTV